MSSGLIDENYFNIQPRDDLLAKCKKCGNKSSAKDFKIDDNLGVMVCSSCFQNSNFESKKKAKIPVEKPVEEKDRKSVV